jgi:rod shape determining protein RodA
VNQSLIAIGSGGLSGKGFLQGTQTKYDFVPEQSTDFIFCTVGEEWGFIGTSVVILLFLGFLYRIIFIAERQRSQYTRIYAYGVASIHLFPPHDQRGDGHRTSAGNRYPLALF